MCEIHRRQFLKDGKMRPVPRRRLINKGKLCAFPECGLPASAHLLCKSHAAQRRQGVELHPLGDREWRRTTAKRGWSRLTEEERERRLAGIGAAGRYERTDDWCRRVSESRRQMWKDRKFTFKNKVCRGCGAEFTPNSGIQVYCAIECRFLSRRAQIYGMTRTELVAILDAQDGLCALCRRPEYGFGLPGKGLHVDHCHATGRVRGFLCGDCNTAIGRFGDDPARLRAAADYLEGKKDD